MAHSTLLVKALLLGVFLFFAGLFLIKAPLTDARISQERVLQNNIKESVPIKVNIKKGKEKWFKSLENGKWIGQFELELTNTGDKPIYFVYITLVSDVESGGTPMVFPLQYGRNELGDIITKAEEKDTPIKPGETHVFTIHPSQIKAWENILEKGQYPDVTKLTVMPQMLSFGDGTGYFANTPFPPPGLEKKLRQERGKVQNKGQPNNEKVTSTGKLPTLDMPASPADFLNTGTFENDEITCHWPGCTGLIPGARWAWDVFLVTQ
jgi:hypothetical protein